MHLSESRQGVEKAPASFREILSTIKVLHEPADCFEKPLARVEIIDAGDIRIETDYAKERSDEIMAKATADLTEVLRQIGQISRAVAFVVGGSDELSLPFV